MLTLSPLTNPSHLKGERTSSLLFKHTDAYNSCYLGTFPRVLARLFLLLKNILGRVILSSVTRSCRWFINLTSVSAPVNTSSSTLPCSSSKETVDPETILLEDEFDTFAVVINELLLVLETEALLVIKLVETDVVF